MKKDHFSAQYAERLSQNRQGFSKYQRTKAIDQVRSAKKELLQKMINNNEEDTYIGYVLQKNRVFANNRRMRTVGELPEDSD